MYLRKITQTPEKGVNLIHVKFSTVSYVEIFSYLFLNFFYKKIIYITISKGIKSKLDV